MKKAQHADGIDDIVPPDGATRQAVVGLGGSAGSMAALERFFDSTGVDTGLAYVVMLHIEPDDNGMLVESLQRHCAMPVQPAAEAVELKPDNVYVIPPGRHLATGDGKLRLAELRDGHSKRVAVDLSFRSLADTHGPQATAVVLSGADGDGANGLKRIKERGGLTIAQDPREADHASMPSSAIATGMVDWVLPVAEMPRYIQDYRSRAARLQLPPEDGPTPPVLSEPGATADAALRSEELQLQEILHFLHARSGHDFSCYKRATVVRRIARRMQVSGVEDMPGYLRMLRTQPGEAAALVRELLISVSNFFRDQAAFQALEPHIAALFDGKQAGDSLRVWVAACATGEEAYSLAMLLLEHAGKLESPPTLQVLACDLDDEAVRFARQGRYPLTIAADVSDERLARFFTKVPNGYRVRREVREKVLFATHDLLKDAPFARIDLLSCRNLLVYLNSEAQARSFEVFNFALNPGGLLFLGSSETVPDGSELFAPLDKPQRIYRQLPLQRRGVPVVAAPAGTALRRVLRQQEQAGYTAAALPGSAFLSHRAPPPVPVVEPPTHLPLPNELHLRLLARFSPPSVVINADYDIVHLSDQASRFLGLPEGEPTRNLLRLAHPALRPGLWDALLAAKEQGQPVEVRGGLVQLGGGEAVVDLRVAPAGELAPGHFLVLFRAHDTREAANERAADARSEQGSDQLVRQLEEELRGARVRLRDTIQQYETANEELKASNEELQAVNEELHSAGEELESGREELQSVNEELTTLNAELASRVEDLSQANSDLHNLISATQIATVFLDRSLRIMRYTPSAVPLFGLISTDVGRPISDLKQRLDYPQLTADAEQVLDTLVPIEREMRAEARWLLARVLPYRTVEDHIAGVVLTFIDITDRKSFESALRASEQRLQTLADAVPQVIWTNDREGRAVYFNRRWYEYSGLTKEASMGPGWQAIVHPDDAERAVSHWQRVFRAGEIFDCEYRLRAGDGSYRWFIGRNVPTRDEQGEVDGWFGTATDIHDLKLAETALRATEEQFRRAIEDAPIPVIMQAEDGQVLQISKAWTDLIGDRSSDIPNFEAWLNRAYGPGAGQVRARMHDLFSGNARVLNVELDVTTREGVGRHWVFSASAPGALSDGRRFIVGMVSDVTERRLAEEQLRESQERLRLIVENARDYAIFSLDLGRRITSWNSGAQAILGFTHEEAIGMSGDVIFTPEDYKAGAPQAEADHALAHGRAADERWHVRKDGGRFWGSGVMMTMRDGPGTPVGFVKIFRDQTAELRAREAMEHARQQLHKALQETEIARDEAQAAGKAKDRFLAVLSHELRAPLTPVLLGAELLSLNERLPADARSTIAVIERNVRLQAQLVDDLLDVSRITHGKVELALEEMDLHDAVTRAVEVAAPDIRARRQRLDVKLEAQHHTVMGDSKRLQQVFWNLLKNASKFTPEGGSVSVVSRDEQSRVWVELRDTGVGFEPAASERIFQVFEQETRDVTVRYGGLGLGLAIAEASVKAHGGSIRAVSQGPGTGATFIVDLPLSAGTQSVAERAAG